jgi:chromosome segregation ATPase
MPRKTKAELLAEIERLNAELDALKNRPKVDQRRAEELWKQVQGLDARSGAFASPGDLRLRIVDLERMLNDAIDERDRARAERNQWRKMAATQ